MPHPVTLILASTSPYRRALLERLHLDFSCHRPEVDESPRAGETPVQLVERLAGDKARHAAGSCPDAIIIGSDQVLLLDTEILSKAGTHQGARRQLERLSGRKVMFQTGLCVLNSTTGAMQTDVIPCLVEFRHLDNEEIERYLAAEQPYDCAGSFKSEGLGIALLAAIRGADPTALVGLPLIRLCEMLRQEGVTIP